MESVTWAVVLAGWIALLGIGSGWADGLMGVVRSVRADIFAQKAVHREEPGGRALVAEPT